MASLRMKSWPQLLSSGLRAATLALRFGLMFYLARNLPVAAVGLFGLYWAGLQLGSSLLTLDVYAHTSRLLLKPEADRAKIMSLHFGFILLAAVLLSPLAGLVFYQSSSAITLLLLALFVVHMPLEIVSTEVGRLLVPLRLPLASNVIMFVRSGLWVIPLVLVMELRLIEVGVDTVIWFWLAGSILGAVVSLAALRRALGKAVMPSVKLDWIWTALAGSGTFLLATLLFRTILGADRFLVERVLGLEAVGVYSLFASVCLGVLALIESGVSAWHYPKLVAQIQAGDGAAARATLRLFVRQNLAATLALMTLIALVFGAAVWLFLAPVYFQNMATFIALVAGVSLYCLSMPFHYVVYGFQRDRLLIAIYGGALCVGVLWASLFMRQFGITGAGIMLALALGTIALGRVLVATRLMRSMSAPAA
jgi:O-antigen/teichoic acid export membrane protein